MCICFIETPLDVLGSVRASTIPHMLRIPPTPQDLMSRLLSAHL